MNDLAATTPTQSAARPSVPVSWPVWLYLATILVLMVAGPHLAPFSETEFHPGFNLKPPAFPFIFGTDEYGRDVFSRVLAGAQPTLVLAVASACVGVLLGTPTGLIAGYFGGWVDEALMRAMDVLMAFPALILSMLIVVMLGGNAVVVITAIGVVFWPRSARLVRSVTMDLARREFIDSARARGESKAFILFGELLPNILNIVVIDLSLRIASAILLTASLSYLGIGVSPPTPAWGLMVRDGQQLLQLAPWLVIFPCLAIALVSIATVLAGDAVRGQLSAAQNTAADQ